MDMAALRKLGGVPHWIQDAENPACTRCAGSMDFIAQISSQIVFHEDGVNPYQLAIDRMLSPEIGALVKEGNVVVIHLEPDGIWEEVGEPEDPSQGGKVILAGDESKLGRRPADRSEWVLPFGDAGIGYLFKCDAECSDTSAAFLWQTC